MYNSITPIPQGCFTGTGVIVQLSQLWWNDPKDMGTESVGTWQQWKLIFKTTKIEPYF